MKRLARALRFAAFGFRAGWRGGSLREWHHRTLRAWTILLLLLALTGCSSVPSRPLAAAWCTEQADDAPGCDVGVGLALARHERLALVGALGAETLGAGVAWVVDPSAGRPVAVSLGAVIRWDSTGFDPSEVYPALGCTISLTRKDTP